MRAWRKGTIGVVVCLALLVAALVLMFGGFPENFETIGVYLQGVVLGLASGIAVYD